MNSNFHANIIEIHFNGYKLAENSQAPSQAGVFFIFSNICDKVRAFKVRDFKCSSIYIQYHIHMINNIRYHGVMFHFIIIVCLFRKKAVYLKSVLLSASSVYNTMQWIDAGEQAQAERGNVCNDSASLSRVEWGFLSCCQIVSE